MASTQINTISRVASNISLLNGAVLDNTNNTLQMSSELGGLSLRGGQILGGSIESLDDTQLVLEAGGYSQPYQATLEGVTLGADTRISQSSELIAKAGLTLENSIITMFGNSFWGPRNPYYSVISFDGTQSLGGTGEIIFNGYEGYGMAGNYIKASNGTLSIDSGITIRTGEIGGAIGNAGSDIVNYGVISAQTAGKVISITGNSFTNYGSLEIIDGGRIVIDPTTNFVNHGAFAVGASTFETPVLNIGQDGRGLFRISDANSQITVSSVLHFGRGGQFQAAPGSVIHMTGSAFENESINPADLAGLANLTLIFEGGADDIDPFEIAGLDLGAIEEGFDTNFELGTLQLGGNDIGVVQLVNNIDNQPGWEGVEALYVDNLTLNSGSTLDLNGFNLYYRTFSNNGGTVLLNGGTMTEVPEPLTLGLLSIGGVVLIGSRRKQRATKLVA